MPGTLVVDQLLGSLACLLAGAVLAVGVMYGLIRWRSRHSPAERRGGALPRHVSMMAVSYLLLVMLSVVGITGGWRVAARAVAYLLGVRAMWDLTAYERSRYAAVRRRDR